MFAQGINVDDLLPKFLELSVQFQKQTSPNRPNEENNFKKCNVLQNYEHSKVELARLAEAMGGESQLTKAIDLARGGSSAEEITLATGLGEDEANAIVKFHGITRR